MRARHKHELEEHYKIRLYKNAIPYYYAILLYFTLYYYTNPHQHELEENAALLRQWREEDATEEWAEEGAHLWVMNASAVWGVIEALSHRYRTETHTWGAIYFAHIYIDT